MQNATFKNSNRSFSELRRRILIIFAAKYSSTSVLSKYQFLSKVYDKQKNGARKTADPHYIKRLFQYRKKVSTSFFDQNLHFQIDWHFFSEGVRHSDFFYRKVESLKFMGKLTDFKNITSASRNLESSIFLVKSSGLPVRTFPSRESYT